MSGCPYSGTPNPVAKSDLTYTDYLKVSDLLSLQQPLSEPKHHDELLFIIIHQAYELWFKLILHELESAKVSMKENDPLRAHHFVSRSVKVMHLLVPQIHILETMSPVEFLGFRDRLMPASGFQSMQFREMEFFLGVKDEKYLTYFKNRPDLAVHLEKRLKEPSLRQIYCELLAQRGYSIPHPATDASEKPDLYEELLKGILPIYQNPSEHLEVYLLSEALIELDEYLGLWREHHVRVVERVIGGKPGTGGSVGVGYLKSTTVKKSFPFLWDVRSLLTKK